MNRRIFPVLLFLPYPRHHFFSCPSSIAPLPTYLQAVMKLPILPPFPSFRMETLFPLFRQTPPNFSLPSRHWFYLYVLSFIVSDAHPPPHPRHHRPPSGSSRPPLSYAARRTCSSITSPSSIMQSGRPPRHRPSRALSPPPSAVPLCRPCSRNVPCLSVMTYCIHKHAWPISLTLLLAMALIHIY